MTYPPPANAVTMWVNGDKLCVAFPPSPGKDKGHTVVLMNDLDGMKNLLAIMNARAKADHLSLGHVGTPTQYDLESKQKILDAFGARLIRDDKARIKAEKAEAKRKLELERHLQQRKEDAELAALFAEIGEIL